LRIARFAYVLPIFALSLVACGSDDTSSIPPSDTGGGEFTNPETERVDDGPVDDTAKDTAADVPADSPADSGTDSAADVPGDTTPPPSCSSGAKIVSVGEGGFAFAPSTLTIKVGDTVCWQWKAGGHSVTSGTGCVADNKFCSPSDTSCSTGTTSLSGDIYEHKFTTAGAFPYFCTPHCLAGMTGTVTVTP